MASIHETHSGVAGADTPSASPWTLHGTSGNRCGSTTCCCQSRDNRPCPTGPVDRVRLDCTRGNGYRVLPQLRTDSTRVESAVKRQAPIEQERTVALRAKPSDLRTRQRGHGKPLMPCSPRRSHAVWIARQALYAKRLLARVAKHERARARTAEQIKHACPWAQGTLTLETLAAGRPELAAEDPVSIDTRWHPNGRVRRGSPPGMETGAPRLYAARRARVGRRHHRQQRRSQTATGHGQALVAVRAGQAVRQATGQTEQHIEPRSDAPQ